MPILLSKRDIYPEVNKFVNQDYIKEANLYRGNYLEGDVESDDFYRELLRDVSRCIDQRA